MWVLVHSEDYELQKKDKTTDNGRYFLEMYDSIVESIPPFSKLNYIYRVLIRVVRGGSTGPRADANGACPFEPESWDSSSPILVYHKPTGVVIKYV